MIRPRRPSPRLARRPILEPLEGRRLLTTFTVNSTSPSDSGSGDAGTLPYCVAQANANSASASTIVFDSTVFGTKQTIALGSSLELTNTAQSETITGPAAGVMTSGGGSIGVFVVEAGVQATMSGMTITDYSNHDLFYDGTGAVANSGTLTLNDCTFSSNYADQGGSLTNIGIVTLNGCTFSGNSAYLGGGALQNGYVLNNLGGAPIYLSGTATLNGCTFSGNSVVYEGGGLFNADGTVTLTDCTFSGNTSVKYGGGLANAGTATLNGCTFSGNAAYDSGGLFNNNTATLTDCTFSGNSAGHAGGGLVNAGMATLTDCTVNGNSAVGDGGGLVSAGIATLSDCTVSGNTADGNGGGLLNGGTVTLNDCTFSGNTAGQAGGLYNDDNETSALTGTIVAGNAGGDIGGGGNVAPASSYNLIGTGGSGGLTNGVNHNIVLTSLAGLGLAPLGNYGGSTRTIALLPGSPAIAAGVAVSGVTADQRGVARPASHPDVGAFQSQGFTLTPVSGSTPQSAALNSAFADPLAVTVTANDPLEPVDGGVITFTAPSSGASASLSAVTANIGGNGQASVTATANGTAGSYTVTATTAGVATAASFGLTNVSALVKITVTPANPSIAEGLTQPFTATGTYSDDSTRILTSQVTWASATGTVATINAAGLAIGVGAGTSSISATLAGVSGSTVLTVTDRATVSATSVSWGSAGNSGPLVEQADGLRLLPAGRTTDMPWLGIDAIMITLSTAAPLSASDVAVSGAIGADYGPVTISGGGATYTIALSKPIDAGDRVTLTIGNAAIAGYTRRLDVLPGDVNDDGVVNSTDAALVRAASTGQAVGISVIFLDVNGDGVVETDDFNFVRSQSGKHLL